MQVVLNRQTTKDLRRHLRRNQTDVEKVLWGRLRNRQLGGYKFYRQYGVQGFVVDFYCPEKKVSVEVDGGQHNSEVGRISDMERRRKLELLGIYELRFWNNEVMRNLEGVLEKIKLHLTSSLAKEEEI
jgi:very-short-patch-repair endonuclease